MTTDYQRNRKTGMILIGGLRARTIPWFFGHFWKCSEVVEFWHVDTFKNGWKIKGSFLLWALQLISSFFRWSEENTNTNTPKILNTIKEINDKKVIRITKQFLFSSNRIFLWLVINHKLTNDLFTITILTLTIKSFGSWCSISFILATIINDSGVIL